MKRRILRAEGMVLLGMVLVVASQFFVWERRSLPGDAMVAGLAFYRDRGPLLVARNGFVIGVWQPLTLCATLAGLSLLFTCTPQRRAALQFVQGACGLACLVVPLTRFALHPGVLMALLGGILIVSGALRHGACHP